MSHFQPKRRAPPPPTNFKPPSASSRQLQTNQKYVQQHKALTAGGGHQQHQPTTAGGGSRAPPPPRPSSSSKPIYQLKVKETNRTNKSSLFGQRRAAPPPPVHNPGFANPWQQQQQESVNNEPAQIDTEASRIALTNLREAEQISVASTTALHHQGEQLEEMADSVEHINSQMENAEHMVKGLSSFKHTVKNALGKQPVGREGRLENQDPDAPVQNSHYGYSAYKGWDTTTPYNTSNDTTSESTTTSSNNPQPNETTKLYTWGAKSKQERVEKRNAKVEQKRPKQWGELPKQWSNQHNAQPGYVPLSKNASEQQRRQWEEQNQQVDEMHSILGNLNEMGQYQKDETVRQTNMIDGMQPGIDEAYQRLESTNHRIDKFLK